MCGATALAALQGHQFLNVEKFPATVAKLNVDFWGSRNSKRDRGYCQRGTSEM